MKKAVIIGTFAVVAIAIAGAAFYFLSNLNSIVAGAVEDNGSQVTQTRVSLSGVDIALREGRGSIKGLRIASPEGYEARDVFSLGDITVDIDLGSVRKDPIVLDEVRIQAPFIAAEIGKNGTSNVDELRKRVQSYSAGASKGAGESKEITKRILIKSFVFEQGRVDVDASALGLEKRTIDLPEIRLTNVGGKNGAPPDKIAQEIIGAVARQVGSTIGRSEIDRLIKAELGDESVTEKAKGFLSKIGN